MHHILSRLALVLAILAVLLVSLAGPAALSAHASESAFSLRILHTNDHHGHLEPLLVDGNLLGGIDRRKTLVDALRGESAARGEPLLLLDAGDVFQGTAYFDRYLGQADLGFYNALAYDAMTIGNHEFDRGDQPLARFIAGANFPVLSANISAVAPSPLAGRIAPWTIVERGGHRIGVVGLTTPHTAWLSAPGRGVTFSDPTAAAQRAVRELEAQGITTIIALAHLGMAEELQLARRVPGVDIVIGGHSHMHLGDQRYPIIEQRADGSRFVYATAWEWGLLLGDLQVQLDAAGRVQSAGGRARPLEASITPDPQFEAELARLRP